MSRPILAAYCTDRGTPTVTEEDAKRLDFFYYSFARVNTAGEVSLAALTHLDLLPRLREMNPALKIILTFASEGIGFSLCTHGKAACDAVAERMVRAAIDLGFDGIDVDWEFPADVTHDQREKDNHTMLIRSLREQMDRLSPDRRLQLSLAVPATGFCFNDSGIGEWDKYLDYLNLMTYDINCGTHYTLHHTAPRKMATDIVTMGSLEESIDFYSERGISTDKLIIGAAWYSRGWHNVQSDADGMFCYAGGPSGYGPAYTGLVESCINKNGYTRYWDDVAKAPYLFNGEHLLTYDDPDSLREKCRMVRERGIAGIMIWEYSHDQTHTLLPVMRDTLDD